MNLAASMMATPNIDIALAIANPAEAMPYPVGLFEEVSIVIPLGGMEIPP